MIKISFTVFIQKSNLLHIFSQQNFQSNYIVVQLEVMHFTLSCDFVRGQAKANFLTVQNLGGGEPRPCPQTNFSSLNLHTTMLTIAPLIQEILSHSLSSFINVPEPRKIGLNKVFLSIFDQFCRFFAVLPRSTLKNHQNSHIRNTKQMKCLSFKS